MRTKHDKVDLTTTKVTNHALKSVEISLKCRNLQELSTDYMKMNLAHHLEPTSLAPEINPPS